MGEFGSPCRCLDGRQPARAAGTASSSRWTIFDPRSPSRSSRAAAPVCASAVVRGPGGEQIVVDDPRRQPIELFEARRSSEVPCADRRHRRLQQVRDDDRRGGPRAGRPARLLRRRRAAEHRGQPRQADGRARPRARLRGRRLRGPAGAPAAVASATRRSSPARPPSSACSSCSATTSRAGSIDVGFLGAAQIDRFGNINTTVIGDYDHPKTRLPGSGGACEIAINARAGLRDHAPEHAQLRRDDRLPDDARATSAAPSRPSGSGASRAGSAAVRRVVVTDLGIYHFDEPARCASTRSTRARPSRPSATRSAGTWRSRRTSPRHAAADRRRAAAHPRGARPGRRLHRM